MFSRESKGEETSIDDQDRENEQACAERGWSIVARYRDKVSASRFGTKERQGWPKIIADVAAGKLDVLVLWEVSRGDRTMDSWAPFITTCRDRGVLIHVKSAETTYDPRIPAHRKALIDAGSDAEYESEKISLRARKGIAGAVLDGKQHGRPPYGYDRVYTLPLTKKRRKFTQKPNEQAAVVRGVITRLARRDPVIVIERDLNARGIPSSTGGRWTRKSIIRMAKNPSYTGLRTHNGTLHPGNWPAIVPRALWEDARAVLAEPDRKTSAPGRHRWLLSYLAVAQCGAGLNVQPPRDRRPARYRCPEDGCCSIGVAVLDEYVTRVVLRRLALPDSRAAFATNDAAAAEARDELAAVEAEQRELEAAARAGMRPALVAAADEGIQKRLLAAQERVKASGSNNAILFLLGDGEFTVATARPRWDALSVAARRASVIATLVERITVYPTETRLTRWASDEQMLHLASERTQIEWK